MSKRSAEIPTLSMNDSDSKRTKPVPAVVFVPADKDTREAADPSQADDLFGAIFGVLEAPGETEDYRFQWSASLKSFVMTGPEEFMQKCLDAGQFACFLGSVADVMMAYEIRKHVATEALTRKPTQSTCFGMCHYDPADTALPFEEMAKGVANFFKTEIKIPAASTKCMKSKMGFGSNTIAWALTSNGTYAQKILDTPWYMNKNITVHGISVKLVIHKKSCAILGINQKCLHLIAKCNCGEMIVPSAGKLPKMTASEVTAKGVTTQAELAKVYAERRIRNQVSHEGERVCPFFNWGKCNKRAEAKCEYGEHPRISDMTKMPFCSVVGCAKDAMCPFQHK